jgi:hypothetical protein
MRTQWLRLLPPTALLAAAAVMTANAAPPDRTTAFDNAYAASFYQFDACGDGIAGRIFRRALVEKLRQCPFSAEARARFLARSTAQRRKSSQMLAKLIEDHGGLPMRLDGMTRTCREQIDSPEYQAVRLRLDRYAAGNAAPDTVIPQACDATEITP